MIHEDDKYNDRIIDTEDLIPDDEPVFLIRAQDILSGDIVREYATRYEGISNQLGTDNSEKVKSIRKHSRLMDEWKKKKLAD